MNKPLPIPSVQSQVVCLSTSYYLGFGITPSPMGWIEDDQNRLVIKPLHIFENLRLNRGPPYLYKEVKQRLTDNPKIAPRCSPHLA